MKRVAVLSAAALAFVVSGCPDNDALHPIALSLPDAGAVTTVNGTLSPADIAHPAPWSGLPTDPGATDAGGDMDASAPTDDAGMDAAYQVTGDTNAEVYTLDLQAGQSVQVVMCRSDYASVLDPYLVVDFNGAHLTADDDSAGGLDARVQIDAIEGGRYTIYATVSTQEVALSGDRSFALRIGITDATTPLGCTSP